jgi:hypothetical protein
MKQDAHHLLLRITSKEGFLVFPKIFHFQNYKNNEPFFFTGIKWK